MRLGVVSAILGSMDFFEAVDCVSSLGYTCMEAACWPGEKADRRYAGVQHIPKVVYCGPVWDDDPQRGNAYAQRWGVDFEGDLQVLLKREDVDAVIVTCATHLHKSVLLQCAQAGKHIYTEKVLTASWEGVSGRQPRRYGF